MNTRREFLKASSAVLAAAAFAPMMMASDSRIPIAFSTLGCPGWDWKKILTFADEHGFNGVELRGLQGNMDLPSNPLFAPDRIAQTKSEIKAAKLKIACVSSSANLYWDNADKRGDDMEAARRFINLASDLGSLYVRVFGGKAPDDKAPAPSEETKARVAEGLHELGEYAAPRNVTVLIESHDHFTSSATLKDVLHAAKSGHVGLLWDAHHTFATSNEDPEYTVSQLGEWIRHTHLKDSVGNGEDRKYVLTGRGTVPIASQIKALQSINYKGFYCFEWEKVWHPDLEDPEIAIADYAKVVGQCLGNLKECKEK